MFTVTEDNAAEAEAAADLAAAYRKIGAAVPGITTVAAPGDPNDSMDPPSGASEHDWAPEATFRNETVETPYGTVDVHYDAD
tara:strand:+ start:679 stop:924 length:246 start_codon:yes stop_codon:yes gene_type:complete